MKKYVIIVAGGSGSRMKTETPKQFIPIGGQPVLMHTLQRFYAYSEQMEIILVLPQAHFNTWADLCTQYHFAVPHCLVRGGDTRFASVKNGLDSIISLNAEDLVAIHDGVRPFVSEQTIDQSFSVAAEKGSAIVVVALKDSIRKIKENASQSVSREDFRLVQTPQTFQLGLLRKAYEQSYAPFFTDDASVVEAAGFKIELVEGNYENIKITTPEDLRVATAFLSIN